MKWEYKTARVVVEQRVGVGSPQGWEDGEREAQRLWLDDLNAFGEEGWELVSEHYSISQPETLKAIFRHVGTLKRPRA